MSGRARQVGSRRTATRESPGTASLSSSSRFPASSGPAIGQPGDVAARLGKAGNEPDRHRVADEPP